MENHWDRALVAEAKAYRARVRTVLTSSHS